MSNFMSNARKKLKMATRFRGLLPIVVDLETTGLNPLTDGLLEIAAVPITMDEKGRLKQEHTIAFQVEPFFGANLDKEALAVTGIDPGYPLRFAIPEEQALHQLFMAVDDCVKKAECKRAVLVGHNAWFDLAFLQAAAKRANFNNNPFHAFTTLDTATLAAVTLCETVLAKALRALQIPFDINQAHSAIYDAEKTAELFCALVNRGW